MSWFKKTLAKQKTRGLRHGAEDLLNKATRIKDNVLKNHMGSSDSFIQHKMIEIINIWEDINTRRGYVQDSPRDHGSNAYVVASREYNTMTSRLNSLQAVNSEINEYSAQIESEDEIRSLREQLEKLENNYNQLVDQLVGQKQQPLLSESDFVCIETDESGNCIVQPPATKIG